MGVRVRAFVEQDAADATAVHDSARRGALTDCTPEQVLRWAGGDRVLLVAVTEGDDLVGWGDLTADGVVDHLSCAPAVVGRVSAQRCWRPWRRGRARRAQRG